MDEVQDGSGGTERSELLSMKGTVDALLGEVEDLNNRLDITDKVVKRGKRNQRFIAFLVVAALILGIGLVFQAKKIRDQQHKINEAISANKVLIANQKAGAIKGCQNSNDSRKGALLLWTTILNAPQAPGSPPRSAQQMKVLEDLQRFINELYIARDCSDLQKTYPLPDVPKSLLPK